MKSLIVLLAFLLSAHSFAGVIKPNQDFIEQEEDVNDVAYELDEQGLRTLEELNLDVLNNPQDYQDFESAISLTTEDDAVDFVMNYENLVLRNFNNFNDLLIKVGRCTPGGPIKSYCCNMYVRLYLDRIGKIPNGARLGIPAHGAGAYLAKYGFKNKIKTYGNPRKAPIGSVLVYKGGPYGHIEVKRGTNAFYFGPTNSSPATEWRSKKRTLIGIWIK